MTDIINNVFTSFEEADLFPIKLIKVDCREKFTEEELQSMMSFIDNEISYGRYNKTKDYPKYQTEANAFLNPVFEKFKDIFYRSCYAYIKNIEGFTKFKNATKIVSSQCWGYRSDININSNDLRGPWHNHHPALLSGVFYLKLPKDDNNCGTEFQDPLATVKGLISTQIIYPQEHFLIIFPGWLFHRSILSKSSNNRYVLAADAFAGVQNVRN